MTVTGNLRKMVTELNSEVQYHLPIGEHRVHLNPLLGKVLSLEFSGQINCIHCDRKTNKSFSQGFCYPCFRRLAACDSCIVSPEKCHFDAGTCREPDWAESDCFVDHIVYLANTSGHRLPHRHYPCFHRHSARGASSSSESGRWIGGRGFRTP